MALFGSISGAVKSAAQSKAAAIQSAKGLSAGARAAVAAAQSEFSGIAADVQSLLEMPDFGAIIGASSPRAASNGQDPSGRAVDIQRIPLALLGGLTLERVRQMHDQVRDARVTRKNLWFISIDDLTPPVGGQKIGGVLNLLALDVSYSPCTMSGEKINVGSAVLDRLNATEAVELSLTTMDDEAGTIKTWFESKCKQAASGDGTFGLPVDYCVNIKVVHAVAAADVVTRVKPYQSLMMMRPQNMQLDLSRRDAAVQELVLTFSEFDSFLSGRSIK